MDSLSGLSGNGCGNRSWKRRNYQRLERARPHRKRVKIVRLGEKLRKKQSRVKDAALGLKSRLITKVPSPLKLLSKLKSAYVNMMLNLAGQVSSLSDGKPFGGAHVTHGALVHGDMALANTEFEKKLVLEMVKSLVATQRM